VFQSVKTGAPLENGRHWFDDAVSEAQIKNFRWHYLRHRFAGRLRRKGAPLGDMADLLGHKSLTHDKAVRTSRYRANCMQWYPWLEQLPPQPPAKAVGRQPVLKLLCSNHFRGVAQW
jgi:integrase